jgi:hypothetical protein
LNAAGRDESEVEETFDEPASDPELEKLGAILAKAASMSAREFGAKARMSEAMARARLKRLVAAGQAGEWKSGRVQRYWSFATGLRPDLGLNRPVGVLVTRVSGNDAERRARELGGKSSFFGLIGEDEELLKTDVEYRLVIQLSFSEKVTRSFIKRVFGPSHDEMLDHLYLHPFSLKIVVYDPERGITLHEKPGDYASRIVDFDGLATFQETGPASIRIRESDLRSRKPDDVIKQSFKRRFDATPKSVLPVFLPVWNLHFASKSRSSARVVCIDGLTGNPIEW